MMREEHPAAYAALADRIDLQPEEIEEWRECAEHMRILRSTPWASTRRTSTSSTRSQGTSRRPRMSCAPCSCTSTPWSSTASRCLLVDVVLALFLQGDRFTAEEKRANFEYYDPITTGDSTLSAVVQSIIAAEVGHTQVALAYFLDGLYVDLANLHRNTSDGVHIASAGGVWNSLVYGFGGMRDQGDILTFDPRLPQEWPSLTFRLTQRGSRLVVRLEQTSMTFTLLEGPDVRLSVRGTEFDLSSAQPEHTVALADQRC